MQLIIVLSRRVQSVSESATVSSSTRAAAMRESGKTIINFGVGEPDFTTPIEEIEFAFEKAKGGSTHYTPSAGYRELREGIAEKVNAGKYNLNMKNVLVTPTKFAINLSFMALADEGDEIIIPEPYFLSYPEICKIYGVKPVTVLSKEDFSLDIDGIEDAITPKTRAIIISNPSNPTGKVYSINEMKKLQRLCLDRDIYFICDQIYEELIYEGQLFDVIEIDKELSRTILISGFSKSYAMTGWRVGYVIASPELIAAMNKLQQQTVTCAPSISQMAAIYALKDVKSPREMKEVFRKRRDLVVSLMKEVSNIHVMIPQGAFYVFPAYDMNISSTSLANEILENKGVLITPGSAFGNQGEKHFRLSYALSDESIIKGIELIGKFFSEQGKI